MEIYKDKSQSKQNKNEIMQFQYGWDTETYSLDQWCENEITR